jgi:hypothetical protein
MPVILESILDIWVWDEMGISWNSLKLPEFKVGDLIDVKIYQDPNGPFYGPTGPTGTTGGLVVRFFLLPMIFKLIVLDFLQIFL